MKSGGREVERTWEELRNGLEYDQNILYDTFKR